MATAELDARGESVTLLGVAPYIFAFLWSTGFVGARYALPHAEPFTLLCIRFGVTALLIIFMLAFTGAQLPKSWTQVFHIGVVGVLAHGVYLGGNFLAMGTGMPLAIVALIGALQPPLTGALSGAVLGERVGTRTWLGLTLGLLGVVLVLWEKLGTNGMTPTGIAGAVAALIAITTATLYQKRFCPYAPLQSSSAIQFAAALAVSLPIAFLFETRQIEFGLPLMLSVAWLSVGLSIGAMMLLWLLVRHGAAAKVASMFYLVPPLTAFFAFLCFGEKLGAITIAGMAVAAAGVALVTTSKSAPTASLE